MTVGYAWERFVVVSEFLTNEQEIIVWTYKSTCSEIDKMRLLDSDKA